MKRGGGFKKLREEEVGWLFGFDGGIKGVFSIDRGNAWSVHNVCTSVFF